MSGLATTLKWDTVFAIHLEDLNAHFQSKAVTPESFDAESEEDALSLAGSFGAWEIVPGGSGPLLRMRVSLVDAIVTHRQKALPTRNISVDIEFRLQFISEDIEAAGEAVSEGSKLHLRVLKDSTESGERPVTVMAVTYDADETVTFTERVALKMLIADWFNDNLDVFAHVFASVNLNEVAGHDGFQWLQPTHVDFAYTDLDHGSGALALLCMTEGRSAKGLSQQVVSTVIPEGKSASFLISPERVLEKLFLPVTPHLFPRSTGDMFRVEGHRITTKHDKIPFIVTTSDGANHDAELSHFELSLNSSDVSMSMTTRTETSPGIHAWSRAENFLGLKLVSVEGGQTLAFTDTRPAIVHNWSENHKGFSIAEIILAVIALIGLAISFFATAGTTLALAAVVVGVLAGVAASGLALTQDIIDEIGTGNAPTFDAFLLNATANLSWTGEDALVLENVDICGSLRMTGHLAP